MAEAEDVVTEEIVADEVVEEGAEEGAGVAEVEIKPYALQRQESCQPRSRHPTGPNDTKQRCHEYPIAQIEFGRSGVISPNQLVDLGLVYGSSLMYEGQSGPRATTKPRESVVREFTRALKLEVFSRSGNRIVNLIISTLPSRQSCWTLYDFDWWEV